MNHCFEPPPRSPSPPTHAWAGNVRSAALGIIVGAALWLAPPGLAAADTGISEERLSLPEGPGSLEGVGENVGIEANMGLMTHSIPIEVPAGFAGVTPELALSYSSGAGTSVGGIGWDLRVPSIERMTLRGLPRYREDDDFAADGGEELVRLPGATPATYRSRFEGSFIRYTWHDAGTDGYWIAEYPDGRVGYFGARPAATPEPGVEPPVSLVPEARAIGDRGTYRYHLVALYDVFGHRIEYGYRKIGEVSLLDNIGYVFTDGTPRYSVYLVYEDRPDPVSDAGAGFEQRLDHRLSALSVFSRDVEIRRYRLAYEPVNTSGGLSRLASVTQTGVGGEPYPVLFTFAYSRTLGSTQCTNDDCRQPYLASMGSLGVSMASGDATLIDMNGDALPDVVDASLGRHRIFLNRLGSDGSHRFEAPFTSALGDLRLQASHVQPLDVDGDGFTDLLDGRSGEVLHNRGAGDWTERRPLGGKASLPDLGEGASFRFVDYDNDKRIDVMTSDGSETVVYRNTGDGFSRTRIDELGASFSDARVQFADINGDGLLDAAWLTGAELRYRLHLGWGRWAPWVVVDTLPFSEEELTRAEIEDMNGDALADVVLVADGAVRYALNRNGGRFDAVAQEITEFDGGSIPSRVGATVLYADMNGSGSTDIVWIDGSGAVTYLELFPVRPNLLARIENGIGMVTDIRYATSVAQMAQSRDQGKPWQYALPHPMVVVEQQDTYDRLTDVHEITRYRYRDGFYDGIEKQFRGYGEVEITLIGDASQESGRSLERFDVGAEDPYRHGHALGTETFSQADDGGWRALSSETPTWDDCAVAGGDGARVRFICQRATEAVMKEGAPAASWATTRTHTDYDGYGNAVRTRNDGVVAIGGDGCGGEPRDPAVFGEPRGPDCLGDEEIVETAFVTPANADGRWILHAPYRTLHYGSDALRAAGVYAETLIYYDGDAFVGLPAGRLSHGLVSRVTQRENLAGDLVVGARSRYDRHGNLIESLDPNGSVDDPTTHRRRYVYDAEGLQVERVEIALADDAGPYTLVRTAEYEPVFDKVRAASGWMLYQGEASTSDPKMSYYGYDNFGRLSAMVRPGRDTLERPTEQLSYELASPVSRVVTRRRSIAGGDADLEQVRCFDGRGRLVQEKQRVEAERYQASGFVTRNVRGQAQRVYQPYVTASGDCDHAPPSGVGFTEHRYDGAYRSVRVTVPDGAVYAGEDSYTETVYEPLGLVTYDAHRVGSRTRQDGLDRPVAIERNLGVDHLVLTYDSLGRLKGWIDAQSHTKTQMYDLLGQVTTVDDPDAGTTIYEYDDAGNLVRRTNGHGDVTRTVYDGLNRPVERWEESNRDATVTTFAYDRRSHCQGRYCRNPEGLLAQTRYPVPGPDGSARVGRDEFGYDRRGQRLILTRDPGLGIDFHLLDRVDNVGRLSTRTFLEPRIALVYTHDGASRLATIEKRVGRDTETLLTTTYDDRGLLEGMVFGNGVTTKRKHDPIMRLSKLGVGLTAEFKAATFPDAPSLLGFRYVRDRLGDIENMTDLVPGKPTGDGVFRYDSWRRLRGADIGQGTNSAQTTTYDLDDIDNLVLRKSSRGISSPAHVGLYTYHPNHAHGVATAGAHSRDYDAAGRMKQKDDLSLSWDHLGRMTTAKRGDHIVARFGYGVGEERVFKQEGGNTTYYVGSDLEFRNGVAVMYARIGRNRVARMEVISTAIKVLSDVAPVNEQGVAAPDGAITAGDAWVVHAADIGLHPQVASEVPARSFLAFVAQQLLVAAPTAGVPEVTYFHQDHLGSLVLATNVHGETVGRRAYTPYGALRASEDFVDAYGFTGQEVDPSTGLLHFRFRYFDTDTGRWASPDPLFEVANTNPGQRPGESTTAYAYVGGNVINASDPTGLVSSLVRATGGVSGVTTNRAHERPYHRPPIMHKFKPGKTFGLFRRTFRLNNRLARNVNYLWVVDREGSVLIAPEGQGDFGANPSNHRMARDVKHGDLIPGPGGETRGQARAGGELHYENGSWILDNNSSYTFNRTDGTRSLSNTLQAVQELFVGAGNQYTDMRLNFY